MFANHRTLRYLGGEEDVKRNSHDHHIVARINIVALSQDKSLKKPFSIECKGARDPEL